MTKLILKLTLIATTLLFILGLAAPETPIMWMATANTDFTLIRLAMIASIVGLLITKPPRNNLFRLILGSFAFGLATWTLSKTYSDGMRVLDTLTLLPFSISCGLTVLELDEKKLSRVPAQGFRRFTASIYAAYTVRSGKL